MARSDLLNSTKTMLASPDTASIVYGLDSFASPRPKGLFYIRFNRPVLAGGSNWRQGHGFFAKAVDLPTVTPQVEELNQYNKKRIIHTGVKYNPISATFYDTVNSTAMQLWNEYAKYYFGDFNHANQTSWNDDITAAKISDSEKTGFGFAARRATAGMPDGLNSQFFFETLEIYQVFGNTFVQTDIINPKINSFEPDGVDYEDMSPLTIRMSLTYEAIRYHNDGQPQELTSSAILSEAFKKEFSGQVFNPNLGSVAQRPFSLNSTPVGSFLNSAIRDMSTGSSVGGSLLGNLRQSVTGQSAVSGVLSRFGSFSFGNIISGALDFATTGSTATSNIDRSANSGSSLFDTDDFSSAVTGISTGSNKLSALNLNEEVMGIANTFSNGTVQIGRKVVSDYRA
jgi:hypothetical protein